MAWSKQDESGAIANRIHTFVWYNKYDAYSAVLPKPAISMPGVPNQVKSRGTFTTVPPGQRGGDGSAISLEKTVVEYTEAAESDEVSQ